ncbi:preprotein translocase subunit YajC [candidate division WOR-3 bacterium]|nr:preprotein translocase subunit YajC [candidate division WOR-3 bacterium]
MINIINFLIAQGCDLASGLGGGEGAAPGACGQGSPSSLLFIVILFAIMYFLFFRPTQVQQKKHKEMIESLQKGDKVISSGGIHGKVTQIKDSTVKLKIADNTEIEIEKGMIRTVLRKES